MIYFLSDPEPTGLTLWWKLLANKQQSLDLKDQKKKSNHPLISCGIMSFWLKCWLNELIGRFHRVRGSQNHTQLFYWLFVGLKTITDRAVPVFPSNSLFSFPCLGMEHRDQCYSHSLLTSCLFSETNCKQAPLSWWRWRKYYTHENSE